jgi:uncharacterized protein
MLRANTSPVKDRIAPMALENPIVTFIACGNTQANHQGRRGQADYIIERKRSGVVRLMELQKQGYAHIRP